MRYVYDSDLEHSDPMPKPGDWRELLTVEAVEAAMARLDAKVERAEALLERDGAEGVIEALRRRGALVPEWRGFA